MCVKADGLPPKFRSSARESEHILPKKLPKFKPLSHVIKRVRPLPTKKNAAHYHPKQLLNSLSTQIQTHTHTRIRSNKFLNELPKKEETYL